MDTLIGYKRRQETHRQPSYPQGSLPLVGCRSKAKCIAREVFWNARNCNECAQPCSSSLGPRPSQVGSSVLYGPSAQRLLGACWRPTCECSLETRPSPSSAIIITLTFEPYRSYGGQICARDTRHDRHNDAILQLGMF